MFTDDHPVTHQPSWPLLTVQLKILQ